ncbi:T9SS C-terminal target domain-containing protein [Sphingobacteriales bacterium UPWRP_1]|nr:hypothetical protein BVG80_05950 [Sphingobacteriales bacterium TSM_CSM]PSJ74482.1 T9SS C-terminal target domain-containing protein [Sphingobacteriales bacterium UPWRP_1]
MKRLTTSLLIAALWLFTIHANATTRYVTTTGSGSGTSWANASADLQAMINASEPGDEVWVATGTYKPTAYPTGCSGCISTRDYTFFVKDGVKIYGGFAGTETDISQRNFTANPTTLSGDFNDDDLITGSGIDLSITGNDENAFHVVLSSAPSSDGIGVTIDGFSITGGNSNFGIPINVNGNSIPKDSGGGIYINYGTNLMTNNILSGNLAFLGAGIYTNYGTNTMTNNNLSANVGGGIYVYDGTNTISNNNFTGNTSEFYATGISIFFGINMLSNNSIWDNWSISSGGIEASFGMTTMTNNILWGNTAGVGGGIIAYSGTNVLTNNYLLDNYADGGGGFYAGDGSTNILTNNIFSGNSAFIGGGISLSGGTNTLTNNLIVGNSANSAGGIHIAGNSTNVLTNNTLIGNSANINGGGITTKNSINTFMNNIFWGNEKGGSTIVAGADYHANNTNVNTFHYNLFQLASSNYPTDASMPYGIGSDAIGNIFAQDPLLVNVTDPDGADDLWFTEDDGLALQNNSPAINAGTPTGAPLTDITGFTRIGNPDLGAYEYNPTISIAHITAPPGNFLTAYPNPFTQSATIAFTLPETTEAVLKVYSIDGREVALLFKDIAKAEQLYTVEFDSAGLAAGIYFVSLTTETGVQQRYLLVLTN